jgi:hypothetical protein
MWTLIDDSSEAENDFFSRYNSLTRLTENDFSGLSRLELLMLHSNGIHRVSDKTFSGLQSLQVR